MVPFGVPLQHPEWPEKKGATVLDWKDNSTVSTAENAKEEAAKVTPKVMDESQAETFETDATISCSNETTK